MRSPGRRASPRRGDVTVATAAHPGSERVHALQGAARASARALHPTRCVRLLHPLRWLKALKRIVRRGAVAAPIDSARRRVVMLQIDGLSARRLRRALARGDMPHLQRWLASGQARLRSLVAATEPSTPVFTAGLLYGAHAGVPGFAWFDRQLGRQVRMDLAEDVSALEPDLAGDRTPLLDGGVSYGTIWPGGAADAFFNVVLFNRGGRPSSSRARNAYDRLVSAVAAAGIAGRVASRFLLELVVGLWDFQRWCRRVGSTRFEWRFLYMRLIVSVIMRDVSTQGAVVDILRGVPRIFIDYLGYDEYAHRRGPDSELALYNLQGIDAAIGRIFRAVRAVPEYKYDVYVFSDHGQMATTPFERIVGRSLCAFVLEHARRRAAGSLEADDVRQLVALRAAELWARTLPKGLRGTARLYVEWLRRRVRRRADERAWNPLDAIEVVTGGSVAHLYFLERPERQTSEEGDSDRFRDFLERPRRRAGGDSDRSARFGDFLERPARRAGARMAPPPASLDVPSMLLSARARDFLDNPVRRAGARVGSPFATPSALGPLAGGPTARSAHLAEDRRLSRRLTVEEIEARHPGLLDALGRCDAIGLMVGRGGDGPVVFWRGRRYRLGDRRALARLAPFRRLGYELCATHLVQAAEGARHGDLVLYGAFAQAGDVSFDFEFGSHGGLGADELDQFVCHPAEVDLGAGFHEGAAVAAEQFYKFFAERYAGG
jgi:hypothetical protein